MNMKSWWIFVIIIWNRTSLMLAAQEDSGWGKTYIRAAKPPPFSDDHDVVLVPIGWTRRLLSSTSRQRGHGLETPRAAKVRKTY